MRISEAAPPLVIDRVVNLAVRLEERLEALAADVQRTIEDENEELCGDPVVASMLHASVEENLQAVLHMLLHGVDAQTAVAPNAALQYARTLAQRGISLNELTRSYRIAQARFLMRCSEDLLRDSGAKKIEENACWLIVEQASRYIDAVLEQVVPAYERERDDWVRHRSVLLAASVRTVLHDRDIDETTASGKLGGYHLRQRHLGVVAWTSKAASVPLYRLEQVIADLSAALGCAERPLQVAHDERNVWAWLPLGAEHEPSPAALEAVISNERYLWIAAGQSAYGFEGFRRTHRQAVAAQDVAVAGGSPRAKLTEFNVIAPVAMMCRDLEAAQHWIGETLGELALNHERYEILRETAHVFLATGGSYVATAEQLSLHRNSAQYRVRKAEELRGRPFREDRLAVELALLACRWLGSSVLRPSASD